MKNLIIENGKLYVYKTVSLPVYNDIGEFKIVDWIDKGDAFFILNNKQNIESSFIDDGFPDFLQVLTKNGITGWIYLITSPMLEKLETY